MTTLREKVLYIGRLAGKVDWGNFEASIRAFGQLGQMLIHHSGRIQLAALQGAGRIQQVLHMNGSG